MAAEQREPAPDRAAVPVAEHLEEGAGAARAVAEGEVGDQHPLAAEVDQLAAGRDLPGGI